MKFAISKQVLLDGLNQVVGVASTKASMPILSNVLIESADGELVLSASNLEMTIVARIPAMIDAPGAITLPAKKLHSVVKELNDGDVMVSISDKGVATIRCERAQFKLHGLPSADFPAQPEFSDSREFKIPQHLFLHGIKCTEFAISADNTRFVLNGIFVSFREGKLTMVATDGRRLALYENDLEFVASQEVDVILPTRTVAELHRMLGDTGEMRMLVSNNQAAFEVGSTVLMSKIVDGTYPNYRQVIPTHHAERIELPRTSLLETVRRVSILASEKSNIVRFNFRPGCVEVVSSGSEFGEAREELPIDYKGREISLAFNADFVAAPLKVLSEDTLTIDLTDNSSPGVMRVADEFLYVIMPMHN